jgi:hypothetical protein
MLKRIVFFALFLWALVDGFLTARNMPTLGLKIVGFLGSSLLSVLFFAAVVLTWTWIGLWLKHYLAVMRLGQLFRQRAETLRRRTDRTWGGDDWTIEDSVQTFPRRK